jgi:hypothetical protein
MSLLDRVTSNVHACEIQLAFQGDILPSTINGWQPFYNSFFQNANFEKAYAGLASINFSEESAMLNGNPYFIQKVNFRFPEHDQNRANRIALIHKIKFITLKYTSGRTLVIGKNDFFQNSKPNTKTSSDGQLCEVELNSSCISPSGFTSTLDSYGLPILIPFSF